MLKRSIISLELRALFQDERFNLAGTLEDETESLLDAVRSLEVRWPNLSGVEKPELPWKEAEQGLRSWRGVLEGKYYGRPTRELCSMGGLKDTTFT